MCHRISPLSFEEASAAVASLARQGRATVPPNAAAAPDAHPGAILPVYVPNADGGYDTVPMEWGVETEQGGVTKLVYNTRIETAVVHAQRGAGLWAKAVAEGRCLVPVHAFYESSDRVRVKSAKTGRAVKQQVRFELAGRRSHLLAGVSQDGRVSIVTTAPNAAVAPVHDRMPLVLDAGEAGVWLGPDFASLADRSRVRLAATPERGQDEGQDKTARTPSAREERGPRS